MVDSISTISMSGVRSPLPARAQTLGELLFQESHPQDANKALVVFEGQPVSYRQMRERAAAIACQFQEKGIGLGDRVGLLFPNHPDYIASFFALSALGAVVVPINPLLKSEEIAHILKDSQAKALVVHELILKEALKSRQFCPKLEHVFVGGERAEVVVNNCESKLEVLTKGHLSPSSLKVSVALNPKKDLALLVYTSGTTGRPKGAMLTHHNILSVFPSRLDLFKVGPDDRLLAVLPMCHIYGIAVVMVGTICKDATMVMLPKFEAQPTLKAIESEGVTVIPAVPAIYQFLISELENLPTDFSSVRLCFCGGSAMPLSLLEKVEEKMGAPLVEGYGLTETSCVATINPLDGVRKPGSVGVAMDGVQVIIADVDGSELPRGPHNVGEIRVKGPNVMSGYHERPAETLECLQDGWFATGDLGYEDEDGYIFVVGRKKEMIIRGGQNIYPREIEEILVRMKEVAEAAVIGVPCEFMGERVKAVLVVRPGEVLSEEQVKHFCNEHLADYKVPRLIEFSDFLPRNSTGKVLKRLLN